VAVALRREGDALAELRVAFTGTNPRPVLLEGTAALCGGPLDERVFKGLDALVRDQIMSMKTTFTPGHYRRRAGVLARRLVARLFAGGGTGARRLLAPSFAHQRAKAPAGPNPSEMGEFPRQASVRELFALRAD
jgi:hypothetical protein